MPSPGLTQKAQESLGLPPGFRTYSPYPFAGMNLQASPVGMADQEFLWVENLIRLGDGNFRAAWDVGAAAYTAPTGKTIVNFTFYTIGSTFYVAVFLSDGSAVQIDTTTLAQTTIGTSGFYTGSGQLPFGRQWGTQYLLISNRNTPNDYWAWDGALLYGAGTAAPNGVNLLSGGFDYSSTPTVTPYGGQGTGMVVVPSVSGGQVVELKITNPGTGYEVNDVVQLAFSGGGSDTSAILEANLDAGGVGGVTITAPGSGYTAATVAFSGGGGSGAAGNVVISNGVTSVSLSSGGSGYVSPTVSFSGGGGTGAAATAVVTSGVITAINVTDAGSGYTSAPTVSITDLGPGTGAAATAAVDNGVVQGVEITNPGSGYTSAPTVTITGDGTGATAIALLAPAGVQSVTVTNGGTGFTSVPLLNFVGGGGAGATGLVKLTPTSIAKINLTASGSGYAQAPTVSIKGGGGSGASFQVVMSGDKVAAVNVLNGGSGYTGSATVQFITGPGGNTTAAGGVVVYTPTSIGSVIVSNSGQDYTSAPAVEVQPGANNSAYATVSLMPFGVSGSAMETYLSRVWIVNPATDPFSTVPPGGNYSVSAPGSIFDFATSDGGVAGLNTDSFLQRRYVGVRQSSGYLYFFGDGSISVVSNVSTSGTPTTTTFNYQNVDPQAGLDWRDSLQDFGRSTIIGNATGIYGLYGGAATKISGKLDALFVNAVFPPVEGAVTPTSGIATLFNIKHYLCLLSVIDPDTSAQRNVMLTWNEKDWVVTSQTVNLVQIATQKRASSYTTWGTDGTGLYPLFQRPSSSLVKRLDTKFYGTDKVFIQKQALGTWIQATDLSSAQSGISGTLSMVVSGLSAQDAFNPSDASLVTSKILNQPVIFSPSPFWSLWGTSLNGQSFVSLGMRLTTQSPDFKLGNWVVGYMDSHAFYA